MFILSGKYVSVDFERGCKSPRGLGRETWKPGTRVCLYFEPRTLSPYVNCYL